MQVNGGRRAGRGGFTLVEVLVVIVIIGVLASLLVVATSAAWRRAKDVAQRQELAQYDSAVTAFQTAYGMDHIPSLFLMDESGQMYNNPTDPAVINAIKALNPALDDNGAANLATHSLRVLRKMFPRISFPVDLNGDGRPSAANPQPTPPVVLQGQHCFVYFLGGINGTEGFANDPAFPTNFAVSGRKGPHTEFPSARLIATSVPGIFAFRDRFSDSTIPIPLAYFSSYGNQNGYTRFRNATTGVIPDCASILTLPSGTAGVLPYQENPTRFYRPTGFQLISAGRTGTDDVRAGRNPFGIVPKDAMGNPQYWLPKNAADLYPTGTPGADDLANFYDNTLGSVTD